MSVTLAPLARAQSDRALHLEILPEQLPFVAPMADMLADPTPTVDFHEITQDGEVVGFFKIDLAYGDDYPFAGPGDIGLRGMVIGAQYQGRGMGSAALAGLGAYLAGRYPQAEAVVLSVNFHNPAARRIYEKAGFKADEAPYLGGRAGPQHVMRLALRAAVAA